MLRKRGFEVEFERHVIFLMRNRDTNAARTVSNGDPASKIFFWCRAFDTWPTNDK